VETMLTSATLPTTPRPSGIDPGTPPNGDRENGGILTLEAMEEHHILKVMDRTGWKISVAEGAAELMGMPPTTLHCRMKKLDIRRPARTSSTSGGMPSEPVSFGARDSLNRGIHHRKFQGLPMIGLRRAVDLLWASNLPRTGSRQ